MLPLLTIRFLWSVGIRICKIDWIILRWKPWDGHQGSQRNSIHQEGDTPCPCHCIKVKKIIERLLSWLPFLQINAFVPICVVQKKAVLFQPASEFLPLMNEVSSSSGCHRSCIPETCNTHQHSFLLQIHKALLETTRSIAGAKVENNKFCVSVHFRCVDEKVGGGQYSNTNFLSHVNSVLCFFGMNLLQCWGVLVEQVVSLLKKYPELRLTQGRKVWFWSQSIGHHFLVGVTCVSCSFQQ